MKTIAIIAAAGQSRRMGGELNKQFIEICGKPLLAYSLLVFNNSPLIDEIFIAIEAKNIDFCRKQIIDKYNITKVKNIIAGGKERQDSIYNALNVIPSDTDYVVIHDGARPMVTYEMIESLLAQTFKNGASITAMPVKDTIKETENSLVVRTIDREKLVYVQTPQAFAAKIIKEAYAKAYENGFIGTDDAVLVERLGIKIKIVEGSYSNIKVTTPDDISIAEALIKIKCL
ncbi:2-C-methyl-D-erythritol 4-phosphate cytidylyltransferase [Candidatus Poribacteria bacterium]|nr:2-C-methyl-D-erythritol 4-phosphate cytidylyltransferase [Candidatus Poribacteria bacterium]